MAANLVFFGVCLAGYLTLGEIPHQLIPETTPSAIRVGVALPGAEATLVEERVLLGLEEALQGIAGVTETSGVATDGAAVFLLVLDGDADARRVGDIVRERVASLQTLPAAAEDPVVSEVTASREILRIAVHGRTDERSLREAARLVQDAVTAVPGVLGAERLTGRDFEMAIEIPQENLTRFGLTFDRVAAALREATADVPAGAMRSGTSRLRVRSEGAAARAGDVARIPLIVAPDGGVVRVGDVGAVKDGFDVTGRQAWMDGEPAVFLTVGLPEGGRLRETTDRVVTVVRNLPLPDGLTATPWYSAAEVFTDRLALMIRNGLLGLGLIFLVLFFTLSTRLAVWTTAGLPFTFFGAFLLMPGLGITLNMVSLFGFIMALGVVVDDAIVVGESIQHRIEAGGDGAEEAAIRGTRQVFFPAAFGVLTTMVTFAPLLGIPGVFGELVADLPRVVIPVLAFSLLEVAWVLPHHLAQGGLPVRPNRGLARVRASCRRGFDAAVRRIYRPALRWTLAHRLMTLGIAVSSLALAVGLLAGGWVPVVTQVPLEDNTVHVLVRLPPGSPPEATRDVIAGLNGVVDRFREEIRTEFGVDLERRRAVLVGQQFPLGLGESLGATGGSAAAEIGQITWRLASPSDRPFLTNRDVADRLRARMPPAPAGANVTVVGEGLGQQSDVSIRVRSPSPGTVRAASTALAERLRVLPGVTSVWDDFESVAPGLVARTRSGGAGLGLDAGAAGRQLRQTFHGEEVRRVQRGREELRIVLRAPRGESGGALGLASLPVRRPDGAAIPLGEVARIVSDSGDSVVRRVDSARAATVFANVDSTHALPEAVLAEAHRRVFPELRDRFPDARFEITGLAGEHARANPVLVRNLLLAVMVVYVLLAVPLGSFVQPFVVMAAVPFGLAGAVFGHLLLGLRFDPMSAFGLAPLVGIVVNDALVLLDSMNRSRRAGRSPREAALSAAPRRFRPVVLTTITTCAGVGPLILERAFQAELLVTMATSLAFGVAFATLVTLFVVPVLYDLASAGRMPGAGLTGSPPRRTDLRV